MNVLDNDYESFPAHTRIPDEDILAVYVELTVNGEYALLPYEEDWRERGPLISASGYQLRKRYDIDWTPSWEDTNLNPFYCEDSIDSSTPNVMDAIRLSDGLPVAIKATLGWTTEASIAFLFTDGGAVEEARNHCVPILDTFIDEDIVYIVMPLLRPFNDPPFLAVAEVIDFIDQLVEGIEYMHQQNVAHRDITVGNIMMDASELYPEGFHPVRQNLSRNGMAEVVGVMRTHAPVRYYLIDFDAAIAFEKGTPTRYKYAEGKAGRDDEVPEFKLGEPYDPFKVDIFQFGNLLKKEFLQKYTGVEFLEPLVREMTRPRPGERPSATSLRVRFNTVRNRLSSTQMRTHLNLKDATDPFRERLLQLGIESLLDSDPDDSPEQSSSEAPTTGNSNRSHDSYWSAVQSMDSSITSQSSIEQPTKGPLNMITDMFSRSRSPSRPSSHTPQETKGISLPWKPAKLREPSPPPTRTAPQPIGSAKDQAERDNSPERSRLKTGRFPWSPSSSPDSVGSPILAVVNQFLQPDTSLNYGDVFDNDHNRRPTFSDDRLRREQAFTSAQYQAPQKSGTPAAMPVRNRRNTVNAAHATAPVPVKAAPTTNGRGRGPMSPMFDESAAPAEYGFFGGQNTRPTAYGKQNNSSNALPMFSSSNNFGWDAQASNDQAQGGYFDMPQYDQYEQYGQYEANEDEDTMRAADEISKYLAQSPPPPKPVISKPVEKKEQAPEKKTKTSKSPFSTLSKKSAPSEPIISTTATSTSTSRTVLSNKSFFGGVNTSNRKSTIAVEDATPFNTPPRTTVNLPSPITTSPVTTKPKKTRTKKGSISEAPKEKEIVAMKDDELSMPPIQDDFSATKTRRRGSSDASATSRPASPMAMFLGSRATGSNSKKEASSKPSATKSSSFKSSAFPWATKAKPSPPVETDWNTDNFSYGASTFSSLGWKNKADESTSMALVRSPATSPNEGGNSDYDMGSEPVSTPPTKSGWKTKASNSYFPSWDSKQPSNSPKEEEDDLAHLMAQMSYPSNAEATPKAPFSFDFSESVPSFQFNSSAADQEGDDYWSGKFSNAARTTAAKAEPAMPIEETSTLPRKASKSKVEPVPEAAPESKATVRGKNKKGAAKTVTKPTIAIESPQQTPTTEAEEWSFSPPTAPAPKTKVEPATAKPASAWSFGATGSQKAAKVEPTPAKVEPVAKSKANESFGNWFGYSEDAEGDELDEETAVSTEEVKPEVEDSWFTAKPKAGAKTSKPAVVTLPVTSKAVKGKKGARVESPKLEPVPEPVTVKTPEQTTPDVEDQEEEEIDDWFAPVTSKGAKSKSTKTGADSSLKTRPVETKFHEEVKPKEDIVEEQADEWWSAPAKGKKGKNAKESEPTKRPTTNAASKWGSLEVENEESKAQEDLAADFAASLGDEEATKVPEPEATPVATVEKEEKPAAKPNVAKGSTNKKKKGKR